MMSTAAPPGSRCLFVETEFRDGVVRPVGRLTVAEVQAGARSYEFVYLGGAGASAGFEPFPAFPDLDRVYRSHTLFPFFANRLMGARRSDYAQYLVGLNLGSDADDFDVLARSGGPRATDRIELFQAPTRDSDGFATCTFFVSQLRAIASSVLATDDWQPGEQLVVERDQAHERVTISRHGGASLGFVPSFAARYVDGALASCDANTISLTVKHVDRSAAGQPVRLLVEFRCCWTDAEWPFGHRDFMPIGSFEAVG